MRYTVKEGELQGMCDGIDMQLAEKAGLEAGLKQLEGADAPINMVCCERVCALDACNELDAKLKEEAEESDVPINMVCCE
eukprot:710879-Alexandrium_andersonii.AAC.1